MEQRELLVRTAKRSAFLAISVNAVLAIVKAITGVIGNSYALIADAVESLSDVVSSLVVLVGISVAAKPITEKHPYGKGRAEGLAALSVAVLLIAAAIGIAIQSIHEIRVPHNTPASFTLIVLVATVLIKELLFKYALSKGKAAHSQSVVNDAWHHRSDALTSIAAFIGISIALFGGPGYESADDWAALFAAVLIAANAIMLLRPTFGELLDSSSYSDLINQIRQIASAVPGVSGTHRCWVRKVGFDYFVDLDILVSGDSSVRVGHDLAHQVHNQIRLEFPYVARVLVHVEPDDEFGRFQLESGARLDTKM